MEKIVSLCVSAALLVCMAAGCGTSDSSESSSDISESSASTSTSALGSITVLSREDGSGTRGAFIELFGIEEEDDTGSKVDKTVATAEITNSTAVMMTSVAGNVNAIGYISLGSLSDTVKAVKIDGAEATVDNIKDGTYAVSRPFNIVTGDDLSDAAADFIAYILSDEGQTVVEGEGYVSNGGSCAYTSTNPSGTVTVGGSSSVTPVMEKLAEEYQAINSNVTVEVQQTDSTTGISSVSEGVCDIGMASRELKDNELELGLTSQVIALDGIAVIVNNDNPIEELTSEQVKSIFTGETTEWSDVE